MGGNPSFGAHFVWPCSEAAFRMLINMLKEETGEFNSSTLKRCAGGFTDVFDVQFIRTGIIIQVKSIFGTVESTDSCVGPQETTLRASSFQ